MEQGKDAGRCGRSGGPGGYRALLPILANSPHCSKSVQVTGEGRCRAGLVWQELHGSCPGAPHGALLRGTGALCISARAQVSKGITHGEKAPEPPRSQRQPQLSLLGPKEFLVNGVPPSKGNQSLPLPALVELAELADSVVAGAD